MQLSCCERKVWRKVGSTPMNLLDRSMEQPFDMLGMVALVEHRTKLSPDRYQGRMPV